MKTACIYHSVDLDGWMSAAIVKRWFEKTNPHYGISNTPEIKLDFNLLPDDYKLLVMIGYNYGQPIPDLSEYDQVIMVDISFPKEKMIMLNEKLKSNFIYIDHHISALKDNGYTVREDGSVEMSIYHGNTHTKFAACELAWKYFFLDEPMPEIVRLLGRYDCFGHKGTKEEQTVLEFQYGARQFITNVEDAYEYLVDSKDEELDSDEGFLSRIWGSGSAIYAYLCVDAKLSYKNGFEIQFYWAEDKGTNVPKQCSANFICINRERFNPINFGIDYHKDGYDGCACFHYANGKYNFSVYNDNGLVDCSAIAKQFGGGGHKGASGFILSPEDFNKLINN